MIDDALMSHLRDTQLSAMNEQAIVRNFGQAVPDGTGGSMIAETVVGPVPCYRFAEVAGVGELVRAGQTTQGLRWKIGLPVGTPIEDDSRIEIGTDAFEILAVVAPSSYDSVLLVYAEKRSK